MDRAAERRDIHTDMHACSRHTFMRMCIHAYIRTYIHTYIHTYVHTYIHTYIRTYIHTSRHRTIVVHVHVHRGRRRKLRTRLESMKDNPMQVRPTNEPLSQESTRQCCPRNCHHQQHQKKPASRAEALARDVNVCNIMQDYATPHPPPPLPTDYLPTPRELGAFVIAFVERTLSQLTERALTKRTNRSGPP